MGAKFAMEADALGTLGQKTSTESEDLGQLVRNLVDAAAPLEGTFNGAAKTSFNRFKLRVDDVAAVLSNALVGIIESIAGQNRSFITADDEGSSVHSSAEGSAAFDAADTSRFAPR